MERNLELLQDELAKPKQRADVLKSLMGRTFTERCKRILEASSVKDIIEMFPLLKKASYVSVHTLLVYIIIGILSFRHLWS